MCLCGCESSSIWEPVIFHGGCHGCTQQREKGIDFCYGCQYFEADWSKPDLSKKPKTRADRYREIVKARVEEKG